MHVVPPGLLTSEVKRSSWIAYGGLIAATPCFGVSFQIRGGSSPPVILEFASDFGSVNGMTGYIPDIFLGEAYHCGARVLSIVATPPAYRELRDRGVII